MLKFVCIFSREICIVLFGVDFQFQPNVPFLLVLGGGNNVTFIYRFVGFQYLCYGNVPLNSILDAYMGQFPVLQKLTHMCSAHDSHFLEL